jgi:hypothetical protein
MLLPVKKHEAVSFFNLINHLHEKCSIIITTNKSPKQWAETLEDEVLATALLDRILYHCELVKLDGNSYRMENRKEILKKKLALFFCEKMILFYLQITKEQFPADRPLHCACFLCGLPEPRLCILPHYRVSTNL